MFDGRDVWPLHFKKDTAVFAFAETLLVKFGGVDVVDCRDYFRASEVREALAEKINKHLARVSVEDFEWLRQRAAFYSADIIKQHRAGETTDAGEI